MAKRMPARTESTTDILPSLDTTTKRLSKRNLFRKGGENLQLAIQTHTVYSETVKGKGVALLKRTWGGYQLRRKEGIR